MARTHFSVGDVEALIPKLERIFTDVLQLRAALRGIEEKLERAGVKMSREELLESDDGSTDVVYVIADHLERLKLDRTGAPLPSMSRDFH